MEAINLTNASSTTKRRALDFYPTPPEVTRALMGFLKLEQSTIIWEPACGDGAMSEVLKECGYSVMSSDLRADSGYGEQGVDFLASHKTCGAIITNPPFDISEEFIRHAVRQAPVVAMVVKSQYFHAKKRQQLFSDCPPAYILAMTWRPDFLFREREKGGKSAAPTMECLWVVWIKGDTNTKYRLLSKAT
jgi:hypothetical protein